MLWKTFEACVFVYTCLIGTNINDIYNKVYNKEDRQ